MQQRGLSSQMWRCANVVTLLRTLDTYSRRCAEHTKFLNSSQPVNAKDLTVVKKIFGAVLLKYILRDWRPTDLFKNTNLTAWVRGWLERFLILAQSHSELKNWYFVRMNWKTRGEKYEIGSVKMFYLANIEIFCVIFLIWKHICLLI